MHRFKTRIALSLMTLFALTGAIGAQQFSDWSAPVNLGAVVNSACPPLSTACNDQHPALSKDGLSLYFSSDRPGGCGGLDIWVSQRASVDSPWEPPFNLGCSVNSSANDIAPNLTTDGHLLFFHSFRGTDNCGGGDIFYTHRQDRRDDLGWEAPLNLNRFGRDPNAGLLCGSIGSIAFVNTPNTDAGPNVFENGATGTTQLYFTRSDQPTMVGDFDIYRATLDSDGTWSTVIRDDELSTKGFRDTRTAIRRRDGLEMILSSERPGGVGSASRDLWVSTRASTLDPWSIPVLLPNVNTEALEGSPALSWDGTELYFVSARAGGFGANDLYVSTRTKLTGKRQD
jgi:WD40-like Beta Propeller Repeat